MSDTPQWQRAKAMAKATLTTIRDSVRPAPDPLDDRRPRIIRVDGTVELLTKPLSLSAFADTLGCQAFAALPLPRLGTSPPYVMVIDAMALDWALAINVEATRIFAHNREQSLGPIRGHAAIVVDGTYGGFYSEVA